MWDAAYHGQACASDLLVAYGIKIDSNRVSKVYTDNALTHFHKMAAALGYDLVKRKEKREAA
jgi:hypothetical protein